MARSPVVCFTLDELNALQGLPLAHQVAYMRGLRPYMDRQTRRVGERRTVSYQGVRETLEEEPRPGVPRPPRLSDDQIYRIMQGLQRIGLINLVDQSHLPPRHRRLIADLPLAVTLQNKSGQNQAATRPRLAVATKPPLDYVDDSITYDDQPPQAATGPDRQAAIPPVSKTTTAAAAREADIDVERPSPPPAVDDRVVFQRPQQWSQFFIEQRGYQIHQVMTVKSIPMFRGWCDRGVSVGVVRDAMSIAEARLCGSPPRSVAYYGPFVDELLQQFEQGGRGREVQNTKRAEQGVRRPHSSREGYTDVLARAFVLAGGQWSSQENPNVVQSPEEHLRVEMDSDIPYL